MTGTAPEGAPGSAPRRRYPATENDWAPEGGAYGSPARPAAGAFLRHAASIPSQLDGNGWPGASRSPRPQDVYNAAVAELNEADAAAAAAAAAGGIRTTPPKLTNSGGNLSIAAPASGSRPGSPSQRRTRSNLAPGTLSPILCHSAPVSPKTSILVNSGAAKHLVFKEHTCSSLRPSEGEVPAPSPAQLQVPAPSAGSGGGGGSGSSGGGAGLFAAGGSFGPRPLTPSTPNSSQVGSQQHQQQQQQGYYPQQPHPPPVLQVARLQTTPTPDSPDRAVPVSRRAFSAPGSQLQLLAMHQAAAEQQQHAGGRDGGTGLGLSSLAARVPAFSCPPLDVSGMPDGSVHSPSVGGPCLDSFTPDSLSPNSACGTVVSVDSPHQPTASRFAAEGGAGGGVRAGASLGLRPRPPGSGGSNGGGSGSTSSTPHSAGALGGGLAAAGVGGVPLPHPLQLSRKLSSKSSGIAMPLLPEVGSPGAPLCGSPVPTVPGDGTPGGSFRRRRSYSRVPALGGLHMAHLAGDTCSGSGPNSPTAAVALGSSLPSRCGAAPPAGFAGGCTTGFTVGSAGSNLSGFVGGASDDGGLGQLQQQFGPGSGGGGAYGGGVQASRPSSARSKAVQALVEAVRSKDEGMLGAKLEYLAGPSGAVAGINDRHPVTGRTALAEATQLNSMAMARRLIACGASPCVGHATAGPPLLQAAACGFDNLAELLLEAGADIEASDMLGWTALHHACSSGHTSTVRLLIKRRANISARTHDGEAPFDLARPDVVCALFDAEERSPTGLGETLGQRLQGAGPGGAEHAAGIGAMGPPRRRRGGAGIGATSSGDTPRGAAGLRLSTGGTPPISPAGGGGGYGGATTGGGTSAASPLDFGRRPRLTSTSSGSLATPDILSGGSTNRTPPPGGSGRHPAAALVAGSGGGDEASPRAPTPPTVVLPGQVMKRLSAQKVAGQLAFGSAAAASSPADPPSVLAGGSTQQPRPDAAAAAALTAGAPPSSSGDNGGGGAQLSDIISAFVEEDQDIVSRFQDLRGSQQQEEEAGDHDPRSVAEDVAAAVEAATAATGGGEAAQAWLRSMLPAPAFAPAFTPPTQQQQQQQQHVTYDIPSVPRFGFGSDIASSGEASTGGFLAAAAHGSLKQQHHQPLATALGGGPDQGQRQQQQQGRRPSGDAGAAHEEVEVPGSRRATDQAEGMAALLQQACRVAGRSSISDDGMQQHHHNQQQPSSPPPPERAESPQHMRGGLEGLLGQAGGPEAAARAGRAAAHALADAATGASAEAIGVRAAAMFGHTTELRTGGLQWTKGELLGEGAYGKVYAGLNQCTGELMAVKALELVGRSGSPEAAAQLEELVQELELYKKLKHKHVVGYIDATFESRTNTLFIFLEFVPGGSIASMVSRFGRFGEELARIYTRQLLLGLEYLHSSHIVHRDVKGANVLVTRDGVVKLADFGASKAYRDATRTDAMKSMRGSVFWMAPEVIKGTGYGRRADIWSLGCTVLEMLTGQHPWPDLDNHWAAMFAIARSAEGPPRPPGISATAAEFLDQCLQVDPTLRPTATELLRHPWVATADAGRRETDAGTGGDSGGSGSGGPLKSS